MKKGPIIAVVSAVTLTLLLVLAPRTPEKEDAAVDSGHIHSDSEGVSELDEKVNRAVEIIRNGEQPPMAAVALLREVLEEDPQHIGALMWLGEFSIMSGQMDKAEARYVTVLAIEPDNYQALEKLLQVYEATGDGDRAAGAIREFLDKNESNPNREALEERLAGFEEQ